ncbi:MAG TPA: TrkH family potassium uptake protein [Kiritimatiellae bacterium]|nr:TrkH family potassium uptake protein [Kiritimatiellia bacterium]
MNIRAVLRLVAVVLIIIGTAMVICAGVAHLYGDPARTKYAMLTASAVVVCLGLAGVVLTRGADSRELGRRDGFAIVSLGWLAAAVAGSLPYILSGLIGNPVSAVFETMSGLTTTGATVLSNLEEVPRGLLLWRATTHFFGGMGVLILCVAVLPFLRVGGMQIYRAELPGPEKERLTPRLVTTARALWGVYVLLCLAEILLLMVGGMNLFDAVCHTFATMATGGFSTRSQSIGAYDSAYLEVVIIVFMLLAGTNFALHYRALRGDLGHYLRNFEFRGYLIIWLAACCLLAVLVSGSGNYDDVGRAVRAAFFQGTSIMTTTGFTTADFDTWPNPARLLLVILMFVGGCAGSTGGGMKVFRILVGAKKVVRDLFRYMRPRVVLRIWVGQRALDEDTVSHVASFILLFVGMFAGATVVMAFFTPDLVTAAASVAATLGNIGPGLGAVGASENYAGIPVAGQVVLTLCMLLGRLELYTVLVMFMPGFWKR